ncbi:MAG: hypothetical protein ACOYON_07815 [Fimbriimonas sp.]
MMISAVVAVAASAFAFGPNSGLNKGESVTPFHPQHVSGPLANSDKCFPCTFQSRPQVQAWINGDDAKNVAGIAKALDKAMTQYKGSEFKALVVFVVEDSKVAATKQVVAGYAKGLGNQVAMAVLPKSNSAVAEYKINTSGDIKNTIFAYKNWKVENKMVNLQADDKGVQALNGAIAQLVK